MYPLTPTSSLDAPQLRSTCVGLAAVAVNPVGTVGGLTATVTGPTQVSLGWVASTDNVAVTGYTVFRDGTALTTVDGGSLSYDDTTIQPGISYSYTVDAFDQAGNHSAASDPAVAGSPDTQSPTVPTGLAATATGPTQVDLSWAASTDDVGVTGYTIYRDGTSIATVAGASLTYSDTSAVPNTGYTYTVDAYDQAGNHSAVSDPAGATTPDIPSSLTFTPVADAYVNSASPDIKYGGSTSLRADASPVVNSYLRFDVQGLGGRSVTQARLLIYANSSSTQGLSAQAVSDNGWGEGSITFNNAPAMGGGLGSSPPAVGGSWLTLEVTAAISGEGSYSFGVSTPGSTAIGLAARESGANAPQLILDLQ